MRRATLLISLALGWSASLSLFLPTPIGAATARSIESEEGSVLAPESDPATAAYYFSLAELYAQEGNMEDASESYRRAVALDPSAPYLRLSFADFLYALGDIPGASEELQAALTQIPSDLEALRLAARVELAQVEQTPESLDRAIVALEKIGELDPDDLDSQLALGRLYVEGDRVGEAIEVFERLLTVLPANRRVRGLLVDSLMRMPPDTGAEKKLGALLERAPDFLPARLALSQLLADSGDFHGVADLLQAAPPQQLNEEELMSRLAGALYHTAELDEANRVLDELLRIDPGHPSGNFFRTLVYQAEGRHAEAETVLRGLLASNPEEVQLVQLLIASLEAQEKWDELAEYMTSESSRALAAGNIDRAMAFRMSNIVAQARGERWNEVLALVEEMSSELPGDIDLGLLRAEALQRLDRTEEAVEALTAIQAEPEFERDIDVRKMQYLLESGRSEDAQAIVKRMTASEELEDLRAVAEAYQRAEQFEEAVVYLEKLIAQDDSIDVQFWLAAAYERVGRHEDSVKMFRTILEGRPDFAPGLNYLGYMWAERGENLDEALDFIQRAVEIDPANGAYIDSMGWVLFQLERFDEAVRYLERAARLVPDDPVVLEHLGDALLSGGDPVRAREHYEAALALEGENAEALQEKLTELGKAD